MKYKIKSIDITKRHYPNNVSRCNMHDRYGAAEIEDAIFENGVFIVQRTDKTDVIYPLTAIERIEIYKA